jgi:hypothetical protein
MGGTSKKTELPGKGEKKTSRPAPAPREEEQDYDDGDFATPKRDRSGDDDQPL